MAERGSSSAIPLFAQLVARLVEERGGLKQDFARAVHVSPTVLSQILAGLYKQPPIELCARLAQVGGVPVTEVLQAAGHDNATTELLAEVFAANQRAFEKRLRRVAREVKSRRRTRNAEELELLSLWRRLDPKAQAALVTLVRAYVAATAPQAATTPAPRRSRR